MVLAIHKRKIELTALLSEVQDTDEDTEGAGLCL